MTPESVQSLIALAIGFSIGGLLASAYRLVTQELPRFELLTEGRSTAKVAAVPLLLFSAPFLIMRNTLMGRHYENRRFEFVFIATIIAGFWSLMSGTVVVMALRASGLLGA